MEPPRQLIPRQSMSDRVAFSGDGSRVLSVARGPVAEVREVTDGRLVSSFPVESGLPPHNDVMQSVALDTCGQQALLVPAFSTSARLYAVESGEELFCLRLEGGAGPIVALGFSRDATLAFVGYHIRRVAVFECCTGRLVHDLRSSLPIPWPGKASTYSDLVCCLASRGERLLASFGDLSVSEWNLSDGKEVATYTQHFHEVIGLAQGSRRVWATQDGRIWERDGCLWQAASPANWHFAVFSEDGHRVLVGSDRGLEAIDLGKPEAHLVSRQRPRSSAMVRFAPAGGFVYPDSEVLVYRDATGRRLEIPGPVEVLRVTNDGRFLVISSDILRWWRLSDFQAGSGRPSSRGAWSLGGGRLFQLLESSLLITDLETGQTRLNAWNTGGRTCRQLFADDEGRRVVVLLTSEGGYSIACFDATEPSPGWVWDCPGSIEYLVCFLKDGSLVLTAREAKSSEPRLIRLDVRGRPQLNVAYSPSGFVPIKADRTYLSVRSGNLIDVYSLDSGRYLETLRGGGAIEVAGGGLLVRWLPVANPLHGGRPGVRPRQVLSPDGRRLLVCYDNGRSALVNLSGGQVKWIAVNMLSGSFDCEGRALILAHNGELHSIGPG